MTNDFIGLKTAWAANVTSCGGGIADMSIKTNGIDVGGEWDINKLAIFGANDKLE